MTVTSKTMTAVQVVSNQATHRTGPHLLPLSIAFKKLQAVLPEKDPLARDRNAYSRLIRALRAGEVVGICGDFDRLTFISPQAWMRGADLNRSKDELALELSRDVRVEHFFSDQRLGLSGRILVESVEFEDWLERELLKVRTEGVNRLEKISGEVFRELIAIGAIDAQTGKDSAREQVECSLGRKLPSRMWHRVWKMGTAGSPELKRAGRKRKPAERQASEASTGAE